MTPTKGQDVFGNFDKGTGRLVSLRQNDPTLPQLAIAGAPLVISAAGENAGDLLTAGASEGWTVTGRQWTRNGVDIGGATALTYAITAADIGQTMGCRATVATFAASLVLSVPTVPAGRLFLDGSALFLDGSNLSLQ